MQCRPLIRFGGANSPAVLYRVEKKSDLARLVRTLRRGDRRGDRRPRPSKTER